MKLGLRATASKGNQLPFREWVAAVRPTTSRAFGALRLVRLVGDPVGPGAELLDEALATGRTSVTEVNAAAIVALVRVSHGGTQPLLLLDGELVVGAKQNRIFNASFLVGPGQSVDLPVSCVEQGRWQYRSPRFATSDTTISAQMRAAKLRRLKASLDGGTGHDSDQQAIWREVDEYVGRSGTHSVGHSFDDAYQHRRHYAASVQTAFEPETNQVGIAAAYDDSLVGLDLFGSPSLYARGWAKVARGILTEVYRERDPPRESVADQIVQATLDAIVLSKPSRTLAPGMGDTLHATTGGVTFTAVADAEVLYHAIAVPSRDGQSG